jgi:NAD(P)H dehydrogenase (quinone)
LTTEGWAGDVGGRVPLLQQKKALIINTTFFKQVDYEKGLGAAMEKLIDDWSFRYPGIQQVEHVYFYATRSVDEKTRQAYLQSAYRLGKEF